jgi:hypothetical protein
MNFASSNGLRLGKCLVIGCSGQGIGVAEVVVPNFLLRPPWKGFFLKKFFTRVAYEKIELKDGIDVKI